MAVSEWTSLPRRQAGLPPDDDLVEGVPARLSSPLGRWVDGVAKLGSRDYWDEVHLRTGVDIKGASSAFLWPTEDDSPLTVVDALLFWTPRMDPWDGGEFDPRKWGSTVNELDRILTVGRSAWRVNAGRDGLERRIDETITAAARQTIDDSSTANGHLKAAWSAVYGRDPNPDLAYGEAIKAVEDLACPLVLPRADNIRTLGTVIRALQNDVGANHSKWELVLAGKEGGPSNVESVVSMMTVLWEGQVSRHAGSTKSRRSSHEEAVAAVHLAVLIVRWLSLGVLRRKAATR